MTKTVIALYDDFTSANEALRELIDRGFSRDNISLMANDASGQFSRDLGTADTARAAGETSATSEGAGMGAGIGAVVGGLGGLLIGLGALAIPGIGPVLAAGPLAAALTGLAGAGVGAVAGGVAGGLIGALVDMGVPEESAGTYAEGVRRGGTLLAVKADDSMAPQAVDILNRHNPIDVNERAAQWRQAGWKGFQADERDVALNQPYATSGTAAGMPGAAAMAAAEPDHSAEDYNLYGLPSEGEQVSPRVEAAVDNSERDWPQNLSRPGQPLHEGGTTNWPEDIVEPNTPPSENERAWPEELVERSSEDRRMSEAGMADRGSTDMSATREDFEAYDPRFRQHFETTIMAASGHNYEQYIPAYRYGYDLASDPRYQSYDWNTLEPEARRYWDERNPGSWDRFKGAVYHAWEEVKQAAS